MLSVWLTFMLLCLANIDSYEISVFSVRSTSAVLSWRSSQPTDVFNITVVEVRADGDARTRYSQQFDGTEEPSSSHTIQVRGLRPWAYHVAILEGCSADACSEAVNATFVTPFPGTVRATLKMVKSTSPSSFEIAWEFPQGDLRLYDGFRVKYCTGSYEDGTCFVAHTKEKNFTAQELSPRTTYYIGVSAQFRNEFGALKLGPPAHAHIETKSYVPVLSVTHKDNIDDGIGTSLLAWSCANGNVSHFQYRLDGRGDWATCNESADCDFTVFHKRRSAITIGYLRITHRRLDQDLNVHIRGCNSHGCGDEQSVSLRVNNTVLPTPQVTLGWKEGGAYLHCDTLPPDLAQGLEILWKCGANQGVRNEQSVRRSPHVRWTGCEAQLHGLTAGAKDCVISVARYKKSGNETQYSQRVQVPLT